MIKALTLSSLKNKLGKASADDVMAGFILQPKAHQLGWSFVTYREIIANPKEFACIKDRVPDTIRQLELYTQPKGIDKQTFDACKTEAMRRLQHIRSLLFETHPTRAISPLDLHVARIPGVRAIRSSS